MTDYYQTLGVSEGASPEEIKKSYRSLANKHHPDNGGDQAKFKDISVAYENLSDPQKKAEYDTQRMYGGGQQFHFNTGNPFGGFDPFGSAGPFGDIFGHIHCIDSSKQRFEHSMQCYILRKFSRKTTRSQLQTTQWTQSKCCYKCACRCYTR